MFKFISDRQSIRSGLSGEQHGCIHLKMYKLISNKTINLIQDRITNTNIPKSKTNKAL